MLESRSILEIIKGRIKVIDKFYEMIVNRAPETANRDLGADNFHDLIAWFPLVIKSRMASLFWKKNLFLLFLDKKVKKIFLI